MGEIIADNYIDSYYGGNTPENIDKWRDKTKEIQISQPWLDDDTARMEAKKAIFGARVNG